MQTKAPNGLFLFPLPFSHFSTLEKKKKKNGNINVEPCHQSDCYQNSFFVGLHAQTLSRFVFLQYDKQKYNTKKACVLPLG